MNTFEKELELCSLITEDACEKACTSFFYEAFDKFKKPTKKSTPNKKRSKLQIKTDSSLNQSVLQSAKEKISEILRRLKEFIKNVISKIKEKVSNAKEAVFGTEKKKASEKKLYEQRTKNIDKMFDLCIKDINRNIAIVRVARKESDINLAKSSLSSMNINRIDKLIPPDKTGYNHLKNDPEFQDFIVSRVEYVNKQCTFIVNDLTKRTERLKSKDELSYQKSSFFLYAANLVSKLETRMVRCITI